MSMVLQVSPGAVEIAALEYLTYAVTVATVIAAATGFAVREARKRIIWRLLGKGDRVAIHIPGRDIGRHALGVATEDFHAAATLGAFFRRRGFDVAFHHIDPNRPLILGREPTVLICGPKSHRRIQALLEQDPHLAFAQDDRGWHLVDRRTGAIHRSPMDSSPPENWDYAYVGVLPRAKGDEGRVLLIAGLHAIGSLGAVSFLTHGSGLFRLWRAQVSSRGASCIVESEHDLERPTIGACGLLTGPTGFGRVDGIRGYG